MQRNWATPTPTTPVGLRTPAATVQAPEGRRTRWALGLPKHVRPPAGPLPVVIAIGGGKGGVGKSLVSANLATKLALSGQKTLLVDLDIGCANLHTHFGLIAPRRTLADYVVRGSVLFHELATATPIPNLTLIPGGRDEDWAQRLSAQSGGFLGLWNALLRARVDLGVDIILLDLGAGTHTHTMDFFALAHVGLVVVLPEPTSIENAYMFLKTSLWRTIDNVSGRVGAAALAGEIKNGLTVHDPKAPSRGYSDKLRAMADIHPVLVKSVQATMQERTIGIVVNQARGQQDIDIGTSMEIICQKYFGFQTQYLGALNFDEAVIRAVRARRLVVQDSPEASLSRGIQDVADKLIAMVPSFADGSAVPGSPTWQGATTR